MVDLVGKRQQIFIQSLLISLLGSKVRISQKRNFRIKNECLTNYILYKKMYGDVAFVQCIYEPCGFLKTADFMTPESKYL